MDPHELIASLGLEPHPEGGHYRETFRSALRLPAEALPDAFPGPRAAATAIYFLLEAGSFSALHRIASDELWFFHAGDPLEVSGFDPAAPPDAPATTWRLGPPPADFSATVPAGWLFGARVAPGGRWSLVSCVVAPGFDFADFTMPSRGDLLAAHPRHAELITRLTR